MKKERKNKIIAIIIILTENLTVNLIIVFLSPFHKHEFLYTLIFDPKGDSHINIYTYIIQDFTVVLLQRT